MSQTEPQSQSTTSAAIVECIDLDFLGENKRRITIDLSTREVTFINCLWPKKFFSSGYDGRHICRLEDVLTANEFGAGKLKRLQIGTRTGRCVVSPDWSGYKELKQTLSQTCTSTDDGGWSDTPDY